MNTHVPPILMFTRGFPVGFDNHSQMEPGYTGYIPGKHPGNVFGSTFADSNTTAMEAQLPWKLWESTRGKPNERRLFLGPTKWWFSCWFP